MSISMSGEAVSPIVMTRGQDADAILRHSRLISAMTTTPGFAGMLALTSNIISRYHSAVYAAINASLYAYDTRSKRKEYAAGAEY